MSGIQVGLPQMQDAILPERRPDVYPLPLPRGSPDPRDGHRALNLRE